MFLYQEYNTRTIYVPLNVGDELPERQWVSYLDWSTSNSRTLFKCKRMLYWHKYFVKPFTKHSEKYREKLRAIEEMIFGHRNAEVANMLWEELEKNTNCQFRFYLQDANHVEDSIGASMYLPMHVLKNVLQEFFDKTDKILMLKNVISTELQINNGVFFHDVVTFQNKLHTLLCIKSVQEFSEPLRWNVGNQNQAIDYFNTTQQIVLNRVLNVIRKNEDLILTLPRPFDEKRISAYLCYEFMKEGYCMGKVHFGNLLRHLPYNSGQKQLLQHILTSVQGQYFYSHYWNKESTEYKEFVRLADLSKIISRRITFICVFKQKLRVDHYTQSLLCKIICRHAGLY